MYLTKLKTTVVFDMIDFFKCNLLYKFIIFCNSKLHNTFLPRLAKIDFYLRE